MDKDFQEAADKREMSEFELAKALHEKVRYSNPMLAFGITQELVLPHMKALGTGEALQAALMALAPETENIDLEDRITLPFKREPDKLRDLVFPQSKNYPETGSESNSELAKILNSVSNLVQPYPIEAMRRPATGDKVLHLPVPPDVASEEKRVQERLRRGQEFKQSTLTTFVSDLHRLLYDGRDMIGPGLQNALHRMPTSLIGGDQAQKALRKVINDFGDVGALVRDGHTIKDAMDILKRAKEMRANIALKKEIS